MNGTDSEGPLTKLRSFADKNEGTAKLADAVENYLKAKAGSVVSGATGKLGDVVKRFTSEDSAVGEAGRKLSEGKGVASAVASGGAKGVKEKAKQALGGGSKGKSGAKPSKSVNIVENIDVGVPVRVAYNQWTRFPDFASFAKGVQSVEKEDEVTSNWTGKILWSSRNWKGKVTEQVQDERIAWSTEAAKGTMKGVVTFHPLGENLTRILLVVEYYPQGFFEKTGNIWRAQGRRLRLDLKLYRRRVMMLTQQEAQEVEGWRGEIREGEVTLSHDDAIAMEEAGLTDEQWAELEDLDEEEAQELAELEPEEREELAAWAEASEEGDEEESEEPEEDEEGDYEDEEPEEPEEDEGEFEEEDYEDEEEPLDEEPEDEEPEEPNER
ncbi:SRPBCC family protein [Nocardiopsis sp. ATB16-24]|uniref:SRPBCC family protein n=1 Tax=Nocardiopsis sp. ATB16-24 TaxID=3019555 RepID=UPI002553E017|nr:SRPBCC family protein [Nocardiopsis sp. ATB16-24]